MTSVSTSFAASCDMLYCSYCQPLLPSGFSRSANTGKYRPLRLWKSLKYANGMDFEYRDLTVGRGGLDSLTDVWEGTMSWIDCIGLDF